MAGNRSPFAGVSNIVRYNWPMYVAACVVAVVVTISWSFLPASLNGISFVVLVVILWNVIVSLGVSWYVYDHSGYYLLDWLSDMPLKDGGLWANIHAGLDETSATLQYIFPNTTIQAFDFYNPQKHTEASIRRARMGTTPFPGTLPVDIQDRPLSPMTFDVLSLLLAAHEIRDKEERVAFLKMCGESLKPGGTIIIAEHLRDWRNFMAYTLGAFHFFDRNVWLSACDSAGLTVTKVRRINPFITVFYCSYGNTH